MGRCNEFVKARQQYWIRKAPGSEPQSEEPIKEQDLPMETDFVVSKHGSEHSFAVFEDEGETGYLYVYDRKENRVLQDVHVYNRSARSLLKNGPARRLD